VRRNISAVNCLLGAFAALLAVAVLAPAAQAGTTSFEPMVDYATGPIPFSVAVGDLNGDGKPDLAVANANSNSVSVLLGNGDGSFAAKVDYTTGFFPESVAMGDLNRDGKPDLAVANTGSASVSVLLGTGDGSFAAKADYATGSNPASVAVGDLNGDGKPDLAVANDNSDSVSVLLGNGDGSFASKADYATGSNPHSVAVGDLNRDGKPDLAVATRSSASVSVLLGTGDGSFAARVDYATGSFPRSVGVGDLNGDGKPDLAVANASSDSVSVLLGNGDGSFAAKVDYATGSFPYTVAVGDLNGDGKPDLAAANDGDGSVSVLLGNGDGSFAAKADYVTGSLPVSVAVGDLDGDGKPDLATTDRGSNAVSVLLNSSIFSGDGTFAGKVDYATGSNPRSVAVGDLNGDGKPDLAVANEGSANVSVLLGNGNGSFAAGADYDTGFFPGSVAVGDLNGDGKPDLAVANSASHSVSVLLGNGGGSFAAKVDYATGSTPRSVAVGDLNRDGKPDLAVTNSGSSSVSVLLGNGGGSFAAKVDYATGSTPRSVAVGDLNGDGKPDLAVANEDSASVSVLLGNGDGSFAAKIDYATGSFPYTVAVGDLNGDGKPDLAVANGASDSVSVLLGNGDGSFAAKTDYATGSFPISVAVGDLNGDGKPDLAVASAGSNGVSVLLGNGDGSFAAKVDYAPGSFSVAVGDLNGDGKPDLALANPSSNGASVLLGNNTADQTITFTAPGDRAFGSADFDPGATASSDLLVTYSSQTTSVCTIASGKVHMIAVGECKVTAEQPGDANYNTATAVQQHFQVTTADQTITFTAPADRAFGSADFDPGATASSGLPVTYSSQTTSVCTIASGKVHMIAVGECKVTAEQPGDANYTAATAVQQHFQVTKASQTITFSAPADRASGSADFDPGATASSGGTVTYTAQTTSVCTIASGKVHMIAAGECKVTAEQIGDPNYNAAVPVQQHFLIEKASQTLEFPAIPDKTFGDPDFDPGASASSGLPVTYSSQTTSVCTIASSEVQMIAAGECKVTAEQPGDANYDAATAVQQHFQVTKAKTTILLVAAPSTALPGQPLTLTASISGASPKGSVSFEEGGQTLGKADLNGAGQASFTTSSLTPGSHQVIAAYAGDANNDAVVSRAANVMIVPLPRTDVHYDPNKPHQPNSVGGPRYTFVFADAAPGVTFYCRLDKARFKRCHSPKVYRRLKRGRHVFRVKSVDAAGNTSPVEVVHFSAGRRHTG
jgi:hypothetical protein